ncbi:histidine kinase [Paenibacillus faecis]|uniref:sensor histidine kinase n=1 Tax=Paenibacillus faecis TaxID=862114 RepID=UPI001B1296AB|nr:sensor histidine kinase [Paenibacillus faecis]GIO86909.1 histidine kinase [Paenibacillus faecis]
MPKKNLFIFILGFTLIPCFFHIYVLPDKEGYGRYLLQVLILLNLFAASRFVSREAPLTGFSAVLILYASWLAHVYGGMINIVAASPVLLYFQLPRPGLRYTLAGFHLLAFNYAVRDQPLEWIVTGNLMMLAFAVLLSLLRESALTRMHADHQFDALRKKHYELDEARNRLLVFTKQVEGAAQAEERNRISRELHDEVGHRLIRAKMMMEAALQVIPGDPDKGMGLLLQIRDQLSSGLDEMRAAVRRIRPAGEAAGILSLRQMLEEVGRETGVRTRLTLEGDPCSLYPSQELILYKNAREAITNALKHGRPETVDIVIAYDAREITMAVSNDGALPGQVPPSQTGGMGMQGMKERCALAGGSLDVVLEPMFTVITKLPVTQRSGII